MSDLVTRLRDVCYCVDGDACGDCQAIHDAAKEIERLLNLHRIVVDNQQASIDALERQRDAEAENARLAQDRVQRLTEGNLRLVGLLRECRPFVVMEVEDSSVSWAEDDNRLAVDMLARLDAALGGCDE